MAEEKKERRPQDVKSYHESLDEVAEFKVRDRKPGAGRVSPHKVAMEKIATTPEMHGSFRKLVSYGNEESALQTAGTLRNQYGDSAESYGWHIVVGDVGDGRHTILVKHTPDAVVAGKADEHRAKVEARKRPKKAAAGAVEGGLAEAPAVSVTNTGSEGSGEVPEGNGSQHAEHPGQRKKDKANR